MITGIGVHDPPEFAFTINWNRCSRSTGFSVHDPPERAFKELKGDLAIRPIYHQTDERIEAHIFVAFLSYCLQATLKQRLRSLTPGLTPRSVLGKMAAIQMVDVHLPTTDGRTVILSRYTEPEIDQAILLQSLPIVVPSGNGGIGGCLGG